MKENIWKELIKARAWSFIDIRNGECWVFYKKSLEKLLKPKPLTKTEKKQKAKMFDSLVRILRDSGIFKELKQEKEDGR